MKTIKKVDRYSDKMVISYSLPNGDYHREDGPAIEAKYNDGRTNAVWYYMNRLHRYGGPAFHNDFLGHRNSYHIHDRPVNGEVYAWLSERGYEWETMSEQEKWELGLFMRNMKIS